MVVETFFMNIMTTYAYAASAWWVDNIKFPAILLGLVSVKLCLISELVKTDLPKF